MKLQQSSMVESTILAFVNQASECTSFVQLLKLWTEIPEECKAPYYEIQKKLEESATVERFYGRSEKNVENFIVWIKEIFEVS